MGNYKMQEYNLKELMHHLKGGEYVIPNFQRDYVWKPKQIIGLFNSIIQNFPIGILTTSEAMKSVFAEGKNEIVDSLTSSGYRSNWIVVDGQQRLTSLAVIYFATNLNLKNEEFSKISSNLLKKCYDNILYWDGKFITKKDLKNKFIEKNYESSLINEKLNDAKITNPDVSASIKEKIDDFKINILRLQNWSDTSIINIFTAMNSGSKKLTHVELMNGSMFNVSRSFDLLNKIKLINNGYKNSGEIKNEFMAQLFKTHFDLTYDDENSKNVVNYKKDSLISWSMNSKDVTLFINSLNDFDLKLESALSNLDIRFNIYSINGLPKNVYLLASLVLVTLSDKYKVTDNHWKRTISFITKRLLDGDYASSPGTKAMDDINKFIIPLVKNMPISHQRENLDSNQSEREDKELLLSELKKLSYSNKGTALFKLAISVLSKQHPRFLFDKNKYVSIKPTAATKYDADLHHFIPTKSNFVKSRSISPELINSIGNMALIGENENRNEIRNQDPSDYMNVSRSEYGKDYQKLLDSHLIDEEHLGKLISIDGNTNVIDAQEIIKNFFNDRIETIRDKIYESFIHF